MDLQPKRTVKLKTAEQLLSDGWEFKDYPGAFDSNTVALIKDKAVLAADLFVKLGNIVDDETRIPDAAVETIITDLKQVQHLELSSGIELALFVDGSGVLTHPRNWAISRHVDLTLDDTKQIHNALTVLIKENIL